MDKRCLGKICVQNLYKTWRALHTLKEVSVARSLWKRSIKHLLVKISAQDLIDCKNEHCATKKRILHTLKVPRGLHERSQNLHRATARAIWQAQSDGVARASAKFAPRHNDSDLRGPKWRQACERSPGNRFVRDSVKNGRWRNFCAVRVIKNAAHVWDHLEWTPGLTPYRKNPKFGHTVWGQSWIWLHWRSHNRVSQTSSSCWWPSLRWRLKGIIEEVFWQSLGRMENPSPGHKTREIQTADQYT